MAERSVPGEAYDTEKVEVRPGVFIKMSPADKKAWEDRQPKEATPNAPAERATVDAPETATLPQSKPRKRT